MLWMFVRASNGLMLMFGENRKSPPLFSTELRQKQEEEKEEKIKSNATVEFSRFFSADYY